MAPGWRGRAVYVAAVCGLVYAAERWPRATLTAATAALVVDFIAHGPQIAPPE